MSQGELMPSRTGEVARSPEAIGSSAELRTDRNAAGSPSRLSKPRSGRNTVTAASPAKAMSVQTLFTCMLTLCRKLVCLAAQALDANGAPQQEASEQTPCKGARFQRIMAPAFMAAIELAYFGRSNA
jgi:hypothetical protein